MWRHRDRLTVQGFDEQLEVLVLGPRRAGDEEAGPGPTQPHAAVLVVFGEDGAVERDSVGHLRVLPAQLHQKVVLLQQRHRPEHVGRPVVQRLGSRYSGKNKISRCHLDFLFQLTKARFKSNSFCLLFKIKSLKWNENEKTV